MEDAWWKGEILAKANNAENLVLESVEESYYYGTEYSSESIALDAKQENVIMPGQLKITASITATFKAELPE